MIIVLSPAKRLDESLITPLRAATRPLFPEAADALAEKLRKFSPARLGKLMGISKELSTLNQRRYQAWSTLPEKPAVRLFDGEVYRGLDAGSLDREDLRFAQRHVRILSGMYGVLRPLDLIVPYRLEMGTPLSMGRGKPDLYAFWGDRITEQLNHDLREQESDVLVNLASVEYFKSVRPQQLAARVVTPVFKEHTAKGLRSITVHAKHQRGALSRWIVQHRMEDPEGIKDYDGDGYRYQPKDSTAEAWLFAR